MAATLTRRTSSTRSPKPSARPAPAATRPAGLAPQPADVDRLWQAYFADRSKPAFDRLVEHYRGYVENVAARVAKRLPPSVDIDDLISAGCFGLMDAISGFDPARATRFETFALKRVVGAMNDSLRAQDIAPRLARRREAQVNRARDDFRKKHGRSPTEEELLRLVNADADEARAIISGADIPCMSSLAAPGDDGDASHSGALDRIADRAGVGSVTPRGLASAIASLSAGGCIGGTFDREMQRWLGRGLTRSEMLIIVLYYFENLTMKEIGQVLGICEGRVSQIHALLLERLRARLVRELEI
jgi:RNA polymerase sigma factor for flagellar operon FliA